MVSALFQSTKMKIKIITFTSFLLILINISPKVAFAQSTSDWPMLAHDVRRWGSTTEQVNPPTNRAWVKYFMEGVLPSVQAVVVNNIAYMGDLGGTFYALNGDTGTSVWEANIGSPIYHTAAVDAASNTVVFGTADGRVVALNTANGATRWEYQTKKSIWNSPLIYQNKVFIGSRDGFFYAINLNNGIKAWSYDTGSFIVNSPAIDPDRNTIYFMSENMYLHALDLNGNLKWKSQQLLGVASKTYFPVVAPDGTVMVTTTPLYSWDRSDQPRLNAEATIFGTEYVDSSQTDFPGIYTKVPTWQLSAATNQRFEDNLFNIFTKPEYFDNMESEIKKEMEANPFTQELWLINPDTGQEKDKAAVLYAEGIKADAAPPLVTQDGKVIIQISMSLPTRYGQYQASRTVAYLNPSTGKLSPFFDESKTNIHSGGMAIADESSEMTAAGRYFLNLYSHHGEEVNYFDLNDPTKTTFGNYYTTKIHAFGVGITQRIVRGQFGQIDTGQEDVPPGIFGAGGGTGYETANMPVSVASGKIFWVAADKLMVLKPGPKATVNYSSYIADFGISPMNQTELNTVYSTWPIDWDRLELRDSEDGWSGAKAYTPLEMDYQPGTQQIPDDANAAKANQISDASLDKYIWEALTPGSIPDNSQTQQLKQELNSAVQEYISTAQWMPFRFQGNKYPSDALVFFTDPADEVEALAYAYPLLDGTLQQQVKTYVHNKWNQQSPITQIAAIDQNTGTPREFYQFAPDGIRERVFSIPERNGLEKAYVAWLWGQNTDDWALIQQKDWNSIKSQVNWTGYNEDLDTRNSYIAGLIAGARLANQFGDETTKQNFVNKAKEQLKWRLGYEFRYHLGNVTRSYPGIINNWRNFPRWMHLTPELGRALQEQSADPSITLVHHYLDRLNPTWYLNWGPLIPHSNGELSTQLPQNIMSGFFAKAFIDNQTTAQDMATYTDVKASKGDPYYIERLAVTLGQYGQKCWTDINTNEQTCENTPSGPGQTPAPVQTACQKADINQDGFVDLSDYSVIAINFLSSSPSNPRTDINADGFVDLTDYSQLALQFLMTCN